MPELRFPEFVNSGEWIEEPLGKIARYENGKAHEKGITETGKFVVVNSKFISTDGEVLKHTNEAFCLAEKDDILMVLSDIPNGKAIAKCFYVDLNDRYTVNQRICKLSSKNADSIMLFYSLNRHPYFLSFDDGVKQTNLRKDDVLNCPVLLPKDLEEQQKIGDCLSSLDELIAAHTRKHQELQSYKKGLLQNLFPAEGQTAPSLRFPEFEDEGEWEEAKLEELATYTKGYAFKSKDYTDKGIRIVRVSDLGADFVKSNNEQIFINAGSGNDYKRYEIKNSEIIITTVGSKPEMVDSAVGRGIYVSSSKTGLLNQNLLKLEVNAKVNSKFLYSNINTKEYQSFIASISRGNANQANIAVKELMKFQIKIPKYEEQQRIAECLSSVDDLITAQAKKIEELKIHRKGLMQQLFPSVDEVGA